MHKISSDSIANIEFRLNWKSKDADHTEVYYGERVNFWSDIFPKALHEQLLLASVADRVEYDLKPDNSRFIYDPKKRFFIKQSQFDRRFRPDIIIEPHYGRFYPKGMLRDIDGVYRQNIEPFRCIGFDDDQLQVDFNHPLTDKSLHLSAVIHSVAKKSGRTGANCMDWIETITNGAGMQVRINGKPTDFFSDDPFSRVDNEADSRFYVNPRYVKHIDTTAIRQISGIYSKFLKPGMAVLDLMGSWTSHISPEINLGLLTGLGLNEAELQANKQLSDYVIHDLNLNPTLPFADNTYHAVVCTVSVEYMTKPFEVFAEVNRVLKAGGHFVVTFSDRWFPPKVVKIWQEIHEFERVGLVTEYFLASGKFRNIETLSIRGWPRPEDDKYYGQRRVSDPVFCVAGAKHDK
jgi:SAM-dependent methyltransferase/FKBP-type peptidyl-prolyl cis-trans isomerase 2